MKLTDALWTEKWSNTPFTPPLADFYDAVRALAEAQGFELFGTDQEPGSSLWLASLSEAMGAGFREDMSVLDYGCGAGRYAQFLRQRLTRFTYYGLENPGGRVRHGEKSIAAGRELFRGDPRVALDVLGGPLEGTALARADVAVLGSIFTHVDLDEMARILNRMQAITARGGKIVFSIFLDDAYRLEGPGAYGFAESYDRVWFTREQLAPLFDERGLAATETESFLAQEVNLHHIFTLTRKPG